MKMKKNILGVDIGGTKCAVIYGQKEGDTLHLVEKVKFPTTSVDETIANISKLFGEFGSNVWFEREADELVPENFACPHCGGKHFDKETDTLDGWFDSGSTHFASMKKDQGFWPATVYLEGTFRDQDGNP